MALPKSVAATAVVVELSGGPVEVKRGLSIGEARMLRKLRDDQADILTISLGTGESREDVQAWHDDPSTSAGDVQKLLDVILEMSGLIEGAQKSS